MKFKIIKKKASSFKELGHEIIELNNISTLYDLLYAFTNYELNKQESHTVYNQTKINNDAKYGKVTFEKYNEQKDDFGKAMQTTIQDFKDGLYRVFINGNEYLNLNEKLDLLDENEVVFIKLVMLAGRLW